MKNSELRTMTRDELKSLLSQLREEEFKLRVKHPTELPNPLRLRMLRRDIARILTMLKEDELGITKLPSKKEEVKKEGKKIKAKES